MLSNKKGHCLATALLFIVILPLSGKPKLLEQNACGTNFQKSPYPYTFLSGRKNEQEWSFPWYC
jgi:hypothetical protein